MANYASADQWTGHRARLLQQAMGVSVERFAHLVGVEARTVSYWGQRPASVPRPAVQQLLDAALAAATVSAQAAFAAAAGPPASPEQQFTSVIDQFAAEAQGIAVSVGRDTVDLLVQHAAELAQVYTTRRLLEEYTTAAQLRSQAADLVTRTRKPAELADLYMVIGQMGALMGSCAFDLGHGREAGRLVQASALYANRAGDAALEAWITGLRATLLLWAGRHQTAFGLVDQALISAPAGQPRYRLRHIGARATAALHDPHRTRKLLDDARRDLDSAPRDRLADDVGGEFHFNEGRAAACAAAAWLAVDDTAAVTDSVDRALNYYRGCDDDGKVPALGAQLDRASAHLRIGDLDAAAVDLEAVYNVAGEHRYSLVSRIQAVAHQLGRLSTSQADTLHRQTNDWLATVTT